MTSTPRAGFVRPVLHWLPRLSYNKFYFDEIYDAMLVRPTRALAGSLKRVVEPKVMDGWIGGLSDLATDFSAAFRTAQSGLIRDYASYMVLFAVAFTIAVIIAAGIAH